MKKLMIAVAAATTLFAVKADDTLLGVTSDFEGDAPRADAEYWDAEGNDGEVTAYEEGDGEGNYLAIDAAEVYNRYIGSDQAAVDIAGEGDGIFFDAMVQFTASEDAPVPGDTDKLVVWLKETETESDPEYTLMVTAGYIEPDQDAFPALAAEAKTYATDAKVAPDAWHQLTIKAIPGVDTNGGILGFTVAIDTELVTSAEATAADADGMWGNIPGEVDPASVFPSMVADDATLTSVGFKGTGAVDDLAFYSYTNPPAEIPVFPPESETGDWTAITDIAWGLPGDPVTVTFTAKDDFVFTDTKEEEKIVEGTLNADGEVEFDSEPVLTVEPKAAQDWPEDPAEVEGQTAAEAFGDAIPAELAEAPADKLATWAKGNGKVDFADKGAILTDAFLLDCANDPTAIEEANDEFVITAEELAEIMANEQMEFNDPKYPNAKVVIKDVTADFIEGDDVEADETAGFYRAELQLK